MYIQINDYVSNCIVNPDIVYFISQLLEMCLLVSLQMYLITHGYHFDFKTTHFTDMCILTCRPTVKRMIKYYTGHTTPLYMCTHVF